MPIMQAFAFVFGWLLLALGFAWVIGRCCKEMGS
jgi:hypothetical protein